MKVVANTRNAQGTGASRRLRRNGKVPGIIYGGEGNPTAIELDHNNLFHALRVESFHSSILDMELDGKSERVLLRDLQWHPYRQQVMHIDFQRVTTGQAITTRVPLHFMNAETSPAVKLGGAIVNHVLNEIQITCLPRHLPEFIEIDLAEAKVGDVVHVSEIRMPEGVKPVLHGKEDPVVLTIVLPAVVSEDESKEASEAEAAAPAVAAAPKKAEKSDKK